MINISKKLMLRLDVELGFSEDHVLKLYYYWLKEEWMLDKHFVMDEPFERDLCELLKFNFSIIKQGGEI